MIMIMIMIMIKFHRWSAFLIITALCEEYCSSDLSHCQLLLHKYPLTFYHAYTLWKVLFLNELLALTSPLFELEWISLADHNTPDESDSLGICIVSHHFVLPQNSSHLISYREIKCELFWVRMKWCETIQIGNEWLSSSVLWFVRKA